MSTGARVTILALAAAFTFSLAAATYGGHARGDGFSQPDPIAFDDHAGWVSLSNGQSLKNWDGDPEIWKLEGGAITGTSTSGTLYLVWKGGEPANFELKTEMKLEATDSTAAFNIGARRRARQEPQP
jgi:3-keto-disaccharide hydrolase